MEREILRWHLSEVDYHGTGFKVQHQHKVERCFFKESELFKVVDTGKFSLKHTHRSIKRRLVVVANLFRDEWVGAAHDH